MVNWVVDVLYSRIWGDLTERERTSILLRASVLFPLVIEQRRVAEKHHRPRILVHNYTRRSQKWRLHASLATAQIADANAQNEYFPEEYRACYRRCIEMRR